MVKKGVTNANRKNTFIYCLISTYIVGIAAHAYVFFHDSFSHDSLGAIYASKSEDLWKCALGRWLVPLYRKIVRGSISSPWLIGLLALLWIGITLYLIVELFQISQKRHVFLLASILTVNLTVIALAATFLFELDIDMFALLLATCAVYMWRQYRWGWIIGIPLITGVLGIYQSYISVVISLIIILLINDCISKISVKSIFKNGMQGIGMLIGGGMVYLVSLKVVVAVTGQKLASSYNGLTNMSQIASSKLFTFIQNAYGDWIASFISPEAAYIGGLLKVANIAVLCFVIGGLIAIFIDKNLNMLNKIMVFVLAAVLPIGMNISCILSGGMVHVLMRYSFWLFYAWALLLIQRLKHSSLKEKKRFKYMASGGAVLSIAILIVIWNNFQAANAVYLKKDMEQKATLAMMTRVTERLEVMPGYEQGQSPVVFVGTISDLSHKDGFEKVEEIGGAGGSSTITYNSIGMFENYYKYILSTPINLDSAIWYDLQEDVRIQEWPSFPAGDSIQKLDKVYVVKLG